MDRNDGTRERSRRSSNRMSASHESNVSQSDTRRGRSGGYSDSSNWRAWIEENERERHRGDYTPPRERSEKTETARGTARRTSSRSVQAERDDDEREERTHSRAAHRESDEVRGMRKVWNVIRWLPNKFSEIGTKGVAIATEQDVKGRANFMRGAFVVVAFALIGVLFYHQIVNAEIWQQRAIEQLIADSEVSAKRGTIYDNSGEKLVQSITAWKVWIHKGEYSNDEKYTESERYAIVQKLAQVMNLSEEYILNRINGYKGSSTVSLKGKIDLEQKEAIDAFKTGKYENGEEYNYTCIVIQEDTRRVYYRGSLASTVLGFTNDANEGVNGVEEEYNTTLSGVPGRLVKAQNATEGDMPFEYSQDIEAQQGNSLVLTINATCQQYLEKYLREAVENNDVRNRACGILMNVNTGAILAMATMPDYDPSDYDEITDERTKAKISAIADETEREAAYNTALNEQWKNKAINDVYEPGSVFKPVTMAAGLEEGLTSISQTFYCPGYKVVAGRRISCHKSGGHGSETLTQGMMNSCNPVFMTLAERLGSTKFYRYFSAFGLTEITGIDLPHEALGVVHSEASLESYAGNLAVSSFGQSFKITPIQMITAISAVVNGGYLVQPHVVEQILDEDGNIVERIDTTVKRQVISESTSKQINEMLEKTVSSGTAKNGYVKGYRIGGKTGTSEKLEETEKTGVKSYVASYCAIAPSDDPEIALLIILDDPKGASHMGGTIAAPVARNVLEDVLPELGIDTVYSTADAELLDTIAPSTVTMSVEAAKSAISAKGLKYRVVGNGDTVVSQIPQGGRNVQKNTTIVLNTSNEEFPTTTVPDLEGMTPAQANRALTNAKLNIRYEGSGYDSTLGRVVWQGTSAGTVVEQGTVVSVEFLQSGATD